MKGLIERAAFFVFGTLVGGLLLMTAINLFTGTGDALEQSKAAEVGREIQKVCDGTKTSSDIGVTLREGEQINVNNDQVLYAKPEGSDDSFQLQGCEFDEDRTQYAFTESSIIQIESGDDGVYLSEGG